MTYKPVSRRSLTVLTGAWLLLIIFTFTLGNPPQCPENYTQAQVDASNCIVGANIGAGMLVMVVLFPLSFVVAGSWIVYFTQRNRSKK